MYKKLLVVLTSSLFFACGPTLPRVNNRTPESYQVSLKQVEDSVPPEKQEAFDLSMTILTMENMKEYLDHGAIVMDDEEEKETKKRLHEQLHGKNYKQIINEVDQIMLVKMENAQQQYVEVLREVAQDLLASGKAPHLQGLVISHNSLTKEEATVTVKNMSKTGISAFILGAVETDREIPFVAAITKGLSEPLQPNESRVVAMQLDPDMGWDRWINGKQAVVSPQWVVFALEYVDGKEVANEEFYKGLEVFIKLRRNYESLLESKKDWRSAFNVDNVAKGFFPL